MDESEAAGAVGCVRHCGVFPANLLQVVVIHGCWRTENAQIQVHEQCRVVIVVGDLVIRGPFDQLGDPLDLPRRPARQTQFLTRPLGGTPFVVAGRGHVDRVVEPDGHFQDIGFPRQSTGFVQP